MRGRMTDAEMDYRDLRYLELRNCGMTFSAIAKAFGTTKGSVIGATHRILTAEAEAENER